MSYHILSLSNVHILHFWNICFKFINWLRLIFILDYLLYLHKLLTEYLLQACEMLISHLLINTVFIGKDQHYVWVLGWVLRILVGIRFDNIDIHIHSAGLDPEVLIKQAFIGLVYAKGRDHVHSSVNQEETIYLWLLGTTSITTELGVPHPTQDLTSIISFGVLVFDRSKHCFYSVDRVLYIDLIRIIIP